MISASSSDGPPQDSVVLAFQMRAIPKSEDYRPTSVLLARPGGLVRDTAAPECTLASRFKFRCGPGMRAEGHLRSSGSVAQYSAIVVVAHMVIQAPEGWTETGWLIPGNATSPSRFAAPSSNEIRHMDLEATALAG